MIQTVDFKCRTIDVKLLFPLNGSHFETAVIIDVGSYEIENSHAIKAAVVNWDSMLICIYSRTCLLMRDLRVSSITFDEGKPVKLDAAVRTLDLDLAYHYL
jgi:hypothetical protein